MKFSYDELMYTHKNSFPVTSQKRRSINEKDDLRLDRAEAANDSVANEYRFSRSKAAKIAEAANHDKAWAEFVEEGRHFTNPTRDI